MKDGERKDCAMAEAVKIVMKTRCQRKDANQSLHGTRLPQETQRTVRTFAVDEVGGEERERRKTTGQDMKERIWHDTAGADVV